MKRLGWILAFCLAAPFLLPGAEEELDTIPPKELRSLLKGEENSVGAAGEMIFSMTSADKAKLRELSGSDREAARRMILDRLEENRRRRQQEAREIRELAKQVRETGDEAKKAELRKLLTAQFERISADTAVRLRMLELRLAAVRRACGERQANSTRMIEEQLEKLTRKRPAPVRKKNETPKPAENGK